MDQGAGLFDDGHFDVHTAGQVQDRPAIANPLGHRHRRVPDGVQRLASAEPEADAAVPAQVARTGQNQIAHARQAAVQWLQP